MRLQPSSLTLVGKFGLRPLSDGLLGCVTARLKQMIKPFLRSLRLLTLRQRMIYTALVVSRMLVNLLDVAGLMAVGLLGSMLASGLTEKQTASFAGFTVSIDSSTTFLVITLLIAGFFLAKSFLSIVLLRITSVFLARVEGRAATRIADYIFSGGLSRVQSYSRGDIHFAVMGSTLNATNGLLLTGSTILTDFALFASVLIVFVLVDVSTAIVIALYFLVLVYLFQLFISKKLRTLGERQKSTSIGSIDAIYDLTHAFREITVLAKRAFYIDSFAKFRTEQARNTALQKFYFAIPRFLLETGLMIGVLALIGWQFLRGNLSDGLVTTGIFLAGGLRITGALVPIQTALANIRTYGPQAKVAQDILAELKKESSESMIAVERSASRETIDSVPSDRGFSVIVSNVTFTHHDATEPALMDVSLKIPTGGYVAFVGPSGAGKTTLADVILGIHKPSTGKVLVDGYDPEVLRNSRPGAISYVPQTPGLVSGTLAQNIALGVDASEVDEDTVWRALEMAQLDTVVKGFSDGIHSSLGKQADALSGGQKQRLGLARALYTSPRLLVLDEATSALDAGTEASVSATIGKLGKSVTVLIIAHRLSTIQDADTVFVIEGGRISAQGKFSDVRRKAPVVEEYVRLMAIQPGKR